MRRWILAAILLLSAAPAALADRHHGGNGRGHYKHQNRARVYYVAPRAPVYRTWAPAYGVVPGYYRSRFRPVPVAIYGNYGPVPYGCQRAYLDGYVVDYRPSNFLVVSFSRVW